MNKIRFDPNQQEDEHNQPYWKRIYHNWSLFSFLFLILVAILYCIVSEGSSLIRPL
jgi:hypothetical protein